MHNSKSKQKVIILTDTAKFTRLQNVILLVTVLICNHQILPTTQCNLEFRIFGQVIYVKYGCSLVHKNIAFWQFIMTSVFRRQNDLDVKVFISGMLKTYNWLINLLYIQFEKLFLTIDCVHSQFSNWSMRKCARHLQFLTIIWRELVNK